MALQWNIYEPFRNEMMTNLAKLKPIVRVQLISIVGATISLLYQETILLAPSESSWYDIMVIVTIVIIALLYSVAIPMYYRKWYAFIIAPVFTTLYFIALNVIWFYLAKWTGHLPQDDLGAGLLLFITLVTLIIGVIIGSIVGTAIVVYADFRRSKQES